MPNSLPKSLKEIERDRPRYRKKKKGVYRSKRKAMQAFREADLRNTSIGFDVRANKRRPPPVPDLTLEEIKELDPDDPRFRHVSGANKPNMGNRPDLWKDREPVTFRDHIRMEKQARARARRAKVRKSEAVVVKAVQDHGIVKGSVDNPAENALVADEILDLDDWDAEELIRGYRRNRKGRFGAPPKYIPREVQQACWRRLVKLGDKKLKAAHLDIIENLISFARGYKLDKDGDQIELEISDKTQLSAMKEVMDRLIGKIPDTLKVQTEAPYEAFLADAVEPIGEQEPQLIERTVTTIDGQKITLELEDGGDPELPAGNDEPRRPSRKRAKGSSSSSKKKRNDRNRERYHAKKKTTKKKTPAKGGRVKVERPTQLRKKKRKKRKKPVEEEVYEGELVEE